jgi:hypothetical protein
MAFPKKSGFNTEALEAELHPNGRVFYLTYHVYV